jgi:hypothetical protein
MLPVRFVGSAPTDLKVTADFTSKYADLKDGKSWSFTVVPWDDAYSDAVIRLAILRATEMWEREGLYAELTDNITRGIVDNFPGMCADGRLREIQLEAYPEAL